MSRPGTSRPDRSGAPFVPARPPEQPHLCALRGGRSCAPIGVAAPVRPLGRIVSACPPGAGHVRRGPADCFRGSPAGPRPTGLAGRIVSASSGVVRLCGFSGGGACLSGPGDCFRGSPAGPRPIGLPERIVFACPRGGSSPCVLRGGPCPPGSPGRSSSRISGWSPPDRPSGAGRLHASYGAGRLRAFNGAGRLRPSVGWSAPVRLPRWAASALPAVVRSRASSWAAFPMRPTGRFRSARPQARPFPCPLPGPIVAGPPPVRPFRAAPRFDRSVPPPAVPFRAPSVARPVVSCPRVRRRLARVVTVWPGSPRRPGGPW